MARTTLDLDDAVLDELRRRRAEEGKPLGVLASELLAQALAAPPDRRPDFAWVSRAMDGRVDLEDKDAVWGALEPR